MERKCNILRILENCATLKLLDMLLTNDKRKLAVLCGIAYSHIAIHTGISTICNITA